LYSRSEVPRWAYCAAVRPRPSLWCRDTHRHFARTPRVDCPTRGVRVSGTCSAADGWGDPVASEGRVTMDRVQIFDTTLRDGEQSPGATMNVEEKLVIARQLEHLGVDVIEAGFAASSEGDYEAVCRVSAAVTKPVVLSLSRTREQDIDRAIK